MKRFEFAPEREKTKKTDPVGTCKVRFESRLRGAFIAATQMESKGKHEHEEHKGLIQTRGRKMEIEKGNLLLCQVKKKMENVDHYS